jgi:membrane glycosyltransferase
MECREDGMRSESEERAARWANRRKERTASSDGLRTRRLLFLAINAVTCAALLAVMLRILGVGGVLAIEWGMLGAFALTLPWLSIGLWNAVIGFVLDQRHGARAAFHVNPALCRVDPDVPLTCRVAIVMPLRNEDADAALARFQSVQRGLARTDCSDRFDFHVLSDTSRPEIAAREEASVAAWRAEATGARIFYRRRTENTGFKSGNIAEFVQRCGEEYDYFLPLDADSVMGPGIVVRLLRVMEATPDIGMLQSLVTGMRSDNFFTRAFQFGMRHGMRAFTLGSAWWQGDCGPNWGHNVLIRMQPFRAHCMLPTLPGRGPLSGVILSHDQIEAAMMRRAGYEVRVIAEESDSHEINPPSVVDFIHRELRWCNGNLQYFRLLALPRLEAATRTQLLLAILMYLSAPAWMAFILLGVVVAGRPGQFDGVPLEWGLGFFALLMTMNLAPKLMGLAQVLASDRRTASYGGRDRVIFGGIAEILLGAVIAPIVAFSLSLFVAGLFAGRRIGWEAQSRSRDGLRWSEAARVLWPQTLAGLGLALWIGWTAPWALAFGAPVLLSLSLAVPVAVLSTHPAGGRWSCATGLFDIPEDRHAAVFGPAPLPEPDPA